MEKDIVPDLLEKIQKDFELGLIKNKSLAIIYDQINIGNGDYKLAHDAATEIGKNLAGVLQENITKEVLPDGKMYYNIADRIINPMLKQNYNITAQLALEVQSILNNNAGIGIKALKPAFDTNRANGIVNKIMAYDDYKNARWLLGEPIINFTQNIVDETAVINADFHAKSGLRPQIERIVNADACKWCQAKAGKHEYPLKDETIYQRHRSCKCIVNYDPKNGKKQNIWNKKFTNENESDKIEKRKSVGVNDNKRVIKTSVINQSQKRKVESDIQKQSLKSIKKSVKSFEKRIAEHKEYINNPYLKIKDFDKTDKRFQKGIKKHWSQEIKNFEEALERRKKELIKRGE